MLQTSLSSLGQGNPSPVPGKSVCSGGEVRRVERIGERSGAGQEIKDGREGKRWVKVKRDLESGARMAHPTSRD